MDQQFDTFNRSLREVSIALANGQSSHAALQASTGIELLLRHCIAQSLAQFGVPDRDKVMEAEKTIGGNKSIQDFGLGQLIGIVRKTDFFSLWEKYIKCDTSALSLINLEKLNSLRVSLVHQNRAISLQEAEYFKVALELLGSTLLRAATQDAEADSRNLSHLLTAAGSLRPLTYTFRQPKDLLQLLSEEHQLHWVRNGYTAFLESAILVVSNADDPAKEVSANFSNIHIAITLLSCSSTPAIAKISADELFVLSVAGCLVSELRPPCGSFDPKVACNEAVNRLRRFPTNCNSPAAQSVCSLLDSAYLVFYSSLPTTDSYDIEFDQQYTALGVMRIRFLSALLAVAHTMVIDKLHATSITLSTMSKEVTKEYVRHVLTSEICIAPTVLKGIDLVCYYNSPFDRPPANILERLAFLVTEPINIALDYYYDILASHHIAIPKTVRPEYRHTISYVADEHTVTKVRMLLAGFEFRFQCPALLKYLSKTSVVHVKPFDGALICETDSYAHKKGRNKWCASAQHQIFDCGFCAIYNQTKDITESGFSFLCPILETMVQVGVYVDRLQCKSAGQNEWCAQCGFNGQNQAIITTLRVSGEYV